MWTYVSSDALYHHGIKGQRWGVKNGPPYPLDASDYSASEKRKGSPKNKSKNGERDFSYAKTSNASVRINKDGSKTFPKGFVFNRVGKNYMNTNRSGGLYVSYGKDDAARYTKYLGPTRLNKLFRQNKATTIQHIVVDKPLKMPSDTDVAKTTAKYLLSNDKAFEKFQNSIYPWSYTLDLTKTVSKQDVELALKNPTGKEGVRMAFSVVSFFGDPKFSNETQAVYSDFRKQGFDAIPDLLDRMGGTSNTAMVIINPDKVSLQSSTYITKDIMKNAKQYVKNLEEVPVNELLDD